MSYVAPGRRLCEQLAASAVRLGFDPPADVMALADDPETEFWAVGEGVLALTTRSWGVKYVNLYLPPGDVRASVTAYRKFQRLLMDRGTLTAVIHPMNLASVRLTLRLGGTPVGLDPEGFIHYDIVHSRYTHAKPSQATGSQADL